MGKNSHYSAQFDSRETAVDALDSLVQIVNDLDANYNLFILIASQRRQALIYCVGQIENQGIDPEQAREGNKQLQSKFWHQERQCFRSTVMCLSRLMEWYDAFSRMLVYIDKNTHTNVRKLYNDLKNRKIKAARDSYIAHIIDVKTEKIVHDSAAQSLANDVKGGLKMKEFFEWIGGEQSDTVLTILWQVVGVIRKRYNIDRQEFLR